jgi:hypothetical protein
MLESELRELFELQASAEQPPSRLSIQATYRAARTRLRIRRLAMTTTPLVAVGAIAAIVLTSSPLAGHVGPADPDRGHHRAHTKWPSAPRYFDALRPYLSFGWLPPRTRVMSGDTGTTVQDLNAGQRGLMPFDLVAYAAGQCGFAHMRFHCAGPGKQFDVLPTRRLPDIDGHPAYELTGPYTGDSGTLIWRYARDGWAKLYFRNTPYAVRVAEHVIFGGPAAPLKFPAQLTGMPGWQVTSALFNPGRSGLLATMWGFAPGAAVHTPRAARYPGVMTGSVQPCYFTPGYSTRSVIAGYPVTITIVPPGKIDGAYHGVCAANADGLWVQVSVGERRPAFDVTRIFAHLRLLGPNPANWTTQPVG